MAGDATPAFGWEMVASRRHGPGPRSRHGLAYDRRAGLIVLFGGIRWPSSRHEEALLSDTGERNR
jgi:hypothetical protein